eukprot:449611-Rhodomonas_salina.3
MKRSFCPLLGMLPFIESMLPFTEATLTYMAAMLQCLACIQSGCSYCFVENNLEDEVSFDKFPSNLTRIDAKS